MLVPGLDDEILQDLVDAVMESEFRILNELSDELAKGMDKDHEEYSRIQLANLQSYRKKLTAELTKLDAKSGAMIDTIIKGAYGVGKNAALADLPGPPDYKNPLIGPAAQNAVKAISEDLRSKVSSAANSILRELPDQYREAVGLVTEQVQLGTMTRKQAVQHTVNKMFKDGVTVGPAAKNGARMKLGDYVTMATRTASSRAAITGHAQTLRDNNVNLVMIQLGPRACETCDQWANRILSTDGTTGTIETLNYMTGNMTYVKIDSTLDTARMNGWNHPNCRCGIRAFIPGVTEVNPDRLGWDKEGYEAQQQQRDIERGIREAKLKMSLAVTPEARAAAQARVREMQGRMRDHMEAHPYLKRQSDREGLGPGLRPDIDAVRVKAADVKKFAAAFESNVPEEYRAFVNQYTPAELAKMKKIYLTNGGKTGLLVKDHGDGRVEMTGLFNGSDVRGGIRPLIEKSIAQDGVNYAECFGDDLRKKYESYGFKVQESYPFDKDQAPKDWDYKKFDHPNYYILGMDDPKVTKLASNASPSLTMTPVIKGVTANRKKADDYSEEGTPEQIKKAVERTKEVLREATNAGVSVRVHPAGLEGILDSGRFKTVHDNTNTWAWGDKYTEGRLKFEQETMGVPADSPTDEYPVYGYGVAMGPAVEFYGSLVVKLKKSVVERTTWTVGDSLMMNARPIFSKEIDTASNDDLLGASSSAVLQVVQREEIDGKPADLRTSGVEYVEAQVFGGVKLSDIDSVSGPVPEKLAQRLRDAGIKVEK